jgi:ABC-type transporter Mla maintaining outer membrane lipid asymmetry permease subunit MlaE
LTQTAIQAVIVYLAVLLILRAADMGLKILRVAGQEALAVAPDIEVAQLTEEIQNQAKATKAGVRFLVARAGALEAAADQLK